ncbi:hypothetical protein AMAG_13928 [Allomyces macrogynus ATCC 38327]|uniref:Signal peptidase subunit 3 n=1 Tax=Allomyces macrogynus (strain ATCC 38327) TaxID=578462 RepID=A0A0L0T2X8_ALLM3|nr:hypothetical protein AMAG_13928 [Allomyces macrogynus ATCC 38327]|eukprot:KNE69057.1 hypothetical protein AMAG_13928 [Allomyces macrogynus ATCC 38327]
MHSLWSRVNTVFGFATSVLLALAAAIALTSTWELLTPTHVPAVGPAGTMDPYGNVLAPLALSLNVSSATLIRGSRAAQYKYQTYFHAPAVFVALQFDATADLRALFQWNTKQVYAVVTVAYQAPGFPTNKITVWDTIITNVDDARLMVVNAENKYAITDVQYRDAARFNGLPITARLEWCVHTYVGATRCAAMPDELAAKFTLPANVGERVSYRGDRGGAGANGA